MTLSDLEALHSKVLKMDCYEFENWLEGWGENIHVDYNEGYDRGYQDGYYDGENA